LNSFKEGYVEKTESISRAKAFFKKKFRDPETDLFMEGCVFDGKMILRFKNGFLHHDEMPALEHVDGRLEYLKNGILHREEGPALIDIPTGRHEYWIAGELKEVRTAAYEKL
jgi:hypothetical protein